MCSFSMNVAVSFRVRIGMGTRIHRNIVIGTILHISNNILIVEATVFLLVSVLVLDFN